MPGRRDDRPGRALVKTPWQHGHDDSTHGRLPPEEGRSTAPTCTDAAVDPPAGTEPWAKTGGRPRHEPRAEASGASFRSATRDGPVRLPPSHPAGAAPA